MWLISTLKKNDGCLYFGALAEKLHNVLVSDPRPYRRDVKYMLRNLLTLAVNLQIEEIVIDRQECYDQLEQEYQELQAKAPELSNLLEKEY